MLESTKYIRSCFNFSHIYFYMFVFHTPLFSARHSSSELGSALAYRKGSYFGCLFVLTSLLLDFMLRPVPLLGALFSDEYFYTIMIDMLNQIIVFQSVIKRQINLVWQQQVIKSTGYGI